MKIGDWVTGYDKGYFQVVGFATMYGFRDDKWYKKGEKAADWVNLKKAFTPKMKFRLGASVCAIEWIKLVSEDIVNEIEQFWAINPEKKAKYDNYTAVEQLGDNWYEIFIVKEGIEFWQNEVDKLPLKINFEQFQGWFFKRKMLYDKQYGRCSSKKKYQYFISIKLIPESIELGKAPLYEKPKLIFGK